VDGLESERLPGARLWLFGYQGSNRDALEFTSTADTAPQPHTTHR
jgi:hypothetical protein